MAVNAKAKLDLSLFAVFSFSPAGQQRGQTSLTGEEEVP